MHEGSDDAGTFGEGVPRSPEAPIAEPTQPVPGSEREPGEHVVSVVPAPGRAAGRGASRAIGLIAIIVGIAAIRIGRPILLPIVLAVFVHLLLSPILRWTDRLHVPRVASAAVFVLASIGGLVWLVTLAAGPLYELTRDLPRGLERLSDEFEALREPMEQVSEAAENVEEITDPDAADEVPVRDVGQPTVTDFLFTGTWHLAANLLIASALLFFLSARRESFLLHTIASLPIARNRRHADAIVHSVEARVSRYLFTITLVNFGLGCAIGATLWLFGVPSAALWGCAAALLNFIPYLGTTAGVVTFTFWYTLQTDSFATALAPALCWVGFSAWEGLVITPAVLGARLTLNKVVVFLWLMLWTWMWGLAGALFAIPLLVVVKITLDNIPSLRPLATYVGR